MKAILVIDMPTNCNKCEVKCDGYTAKQYAEKGITRPNWCPLRPLPDEKEDLFYPCNEYVRAVNEGWNACLDEILGETE